MSDKTETVERPRYPGNPNSSPGLWLLLGALLGFFGGVIAASGEGGEAVGVIVAAVGGVLLTIGAVAKGVEVGIRNARD